MPKPLALSEIQMRAAAFVADWRTEPGEEKQQAQSFVRDLLAVYGITKTKAGLYEKRAKRTSTGGSGYIDALVPGLCLIEMKSRGKDLVEAERQALDYIDALPEIEAPRWVITSDFATLRILDLQAEDGSDLEQFALDDLSRRSGTLAFLAGYQAERSFGSRAQEAASIKAARLMGDLYEELEGSGYADHEASVFLVRTLLCLYADDAGVWGERDLFYEFLETRTSEDGSDLGGQLSMLYQSLNKPVEKRQTNLDPLIARFPFVNGGVFSEQVSIPAFSSGMRAQLIEMCSFNWSSISPAIFGSLFQAVKDKKARRELGEHYTTETNILKTIDPLFMDELRDKFAHNVHSVAGLKKLRQELGDLRVMDPACGCGNFLIVAYRELRALDLQILLRLQQLGDTSEMPGIFFTADQLPVTLEHFAGIEIEEWPARIAQTALHLVDHQANQRMEVALGTAPDPLPLGTITTIHVANALRTDWATVMPPSPDVRIVGNPPFSGARKMTPEQKSDMALIWGTLGGDLDYVTAWHLQASKYFARARGGRFALVSTNSISQGEPVETLFRPLFAAGWRLRFAHQTFAWTSEAPGAAAVHCVITGFDKNEKEPAVLYTYDTLKGHPKAVPAVTINAYLVDAPTVFVTKRTSGPLSPALPAVRFGSMPNDGGGLLVGPDEYGQLAADPVGAKYLRRFVGAKELVHDLPRWCLWLTNLAPADVARSPILKRRLEFVRTRRLDSAKAVTRALAATPSLFGEIRQPDGPYLAIPRHVTEDRTYFTATRLESDVICGDANFTALDPDGFLFAIISSSMFMAWQRAVGGRIKSDLRFSGTVVWNNLPLPDVNSALRSQIIAFGQAVLDARALHPERSLAQHYNPLAMDPALVRAHQTLDRAVDKAFGARGTLHAVEERQKVLFARYAEMTAGLVR